MLSGRLFFLETGKRLHDRIQVLQEAVALWCRQARENAFIDATRAWIMALQHLRALIRQLDGIGTGIVPRAPTLQQTLFEHATNDVGERRPINARQIDELRLTEAL